MPRIVVLCSLIVVTFGLHAQAAGPIDGEFSVVWWANDLENDDGLANISADSGAPGFKAALWLHDRYGVRASQFGSDADDFGGNGADYTSVDVMWRAFAPAKNKFLAVGLGWQQMQLDGLGMGGDTSGVRLSVEGRLSLMRAAYAYGEGSLLPSLDDAPASDPALGRFEDMESFEYELGVAWTMTPLVSLRAGYRVNETDFRTSGPAVAPGATTVPFIIDEGGQDGPNILAKINSAGTGCSSCSTTAVIPAGTSASKGFFVGVGMRF